MNVDGSVELQEPAGTLRFSHRAMNTVFEIICTHPDADYARQATLAAFDVLGKLEQELSRFIENSDISRINALSAGETTRVNRWTMECLELAQRGHAETAGAFDISLGTGLDRIALERADMLVRAARTGARLDLGGIGKGYAVDRVVEILADWEIPRAVVHGGYSSVRVLDAPAGRAGWPLSMTMPNANEPFRLIEAHQIAFSASGTRKHDHVLDPRGGRPVRTQRASWAIAPPEALAGFAAPASSSPGAVLEIFSTAFLILESVQIAELCRRYPGLEAWIAESDSAGVARVTHFPA